MEHVPRNSSPPANGHLDPVDAGARRYRLVHRAAPRPEVAAIAERPPRLESTTP